MEKELRKYWYNTYTRGPNGVSSASSGTTVRANTRVGAPNPGWRKRVSDVNFVASAYTLDRFFLDLQGSACGLAWTRVNGGKVEECFTFFSGVNVNNSYGFPVDPFTTSESSAALATAQNRLLNKVRKEHSETNGLLILGELRETIHMIRHPFAGFVKICRNYASSLKRHARTARTRKAYVSGLSDLYLEAAFGWKPLMSDIDDLCRTAARIIVDRRPFLRVSSQVACEPRATSIAGTSIGPFDCQMKHTEKSLCEKSYKLIAFLDQSVGGPLSPLQRVMELSGFTVENFVPTIYNLVPFSFLLDYVSNLGDVISGACTAQSKVRGVVKTERTILQRFESFPFNAAATIAAVGGYNHRPYGATGGTIESKEVKLSRTISGLAEVPDLLLQIPGSNQFANVGALITGWFSGIRPPRR